MRSSQGKGLIVDAAFANMVTPLMIAARHCHVEVVKTLITSGLTFFAMTKRDVTSLHMAVEVCASDGCEKALDD